ncbi:MAG: energy transducer TonB, partial [Verrucomicrobiae bacterium]|nr:energy transducer TonB [Verrucomicrobiae bacterium]
LGAGEGGRGEVPVIEVSVAAVAPVETTGDGEDVMDEPPPVREATPLETEWDQPDPVETPPLPLEVERLAERPAEPVTEFLVAETGPSMVFPKPAAKSKPESSPTVGREESPKKTSAKSKTAAPEISKGKAKTVPPRPLSPVAPAYPKSSKAAGNEGTAWVLVVVKANGSLRSASLKRGTGDRALDSAAIACVRKWRFAPGMEDGRAVEGSALVKVSFRLR